VDVEHVAAAGVGPELADRLEERQRLDVAHRAAISTITRSTSPPTARMLALISSVI